MKPPSPHFRGVAAAAALVAAVAMTLSCTALIGDFDAGLGGGPSQSTSSASSTASATSSNVASSSATSSTSSTTASSSSSSTGGMCSTSPCSYLAPQCCPSGDHCTPDDNFKPACAAEGTQPPGATCVHDTDCAGAARCDSPGQCRAFCENDLECGGGNSCGVAVYGFDGMSVNVIATVCGDVCDPTKSGAASGCPSGSKCDVDAAAAGADQWLTRCFIAGSSPAGAACQLITDCAPGNGCLSEAGGNTCRRYCDFASGAANLGCDAGQSCVDFSPQANVHGRHFGVCK